MTVKEAIDAIDLLKPNQFDEQMKTAWISQAEALVQNEVLSYHRRKSLPPPFITIRRTREQFYWFQSRIPTYM